MNTYDKFIKDLKQYQKKLFDVLPVEIKADILLAQHDAHMKHTKKSAQLRDAQKPKTRFIWGRS